MTRVDITLTVNGRVYELTVRPGERLVDVLRGRLGLTVTKEGCGEGECGACTVNMNGQAVLSCLILAVQADGSTLLTIEGLQKNAELHPLQEAFLTESAVQCGYCTPGMVMNAVDICRKHPNPSAQQIREQLEGNICRCTGYQNIVKAVQQGAAAMKA